MNWIKENLRNILLTLIILGCIYLVYLFAIGYDKNKEEETYKKIEETCRTILLQQPNNQILYENCIENGKEVFSPADYSNDY